MPPQKSITQSDSYKRAKYYFKHQCYTRAIKEFQETLNCRDYSLTDERVVIGGIHYKMGQAYWHLNQFSHALEEFNQAKKCFYSKNKAQWLIAPTEQYNLFSEFSELMKHFDRNSEALYYYTKRLNILKTHFPSYKIQIGELCLQIGKLYYCLGEYSKALYGYNVGYRCFSIGKSDDWSDFPYKWLDLYRGKAIIYQQLGYRAEEIKCNHILQDILECNFPEKLSERIEILNNISVLYQSICSFDKAIFAADKAIKLLQENNQDKTFDYALFMQRRGELYFINKDFLKALYNKQTALNIISRYFPGNKTEKIMLLTELGKIYYELNCYELLESVIKTALELLDPQDKVNNELISELSEGIAKFELTHGNLYNSLTIAEEALCFRLKDSEEYNIKIARNLKTLSRIYEYLGDTGKSIDLIYRAYLICHKNSRVHPETRSLRELLAEKAPDYLSLKFPRQLLNTTKSEITDKLTFKIKTKLQHAILNKVYDLAYKDIWLAEGPEGEGESGVSFYTREDVITNSLEELGHESDSRDITLMLILEQINLAALRTGIASNNCINNFQLKFPEIIDGANENRLEYFVDSSIFLQYKPDDVEVGNAILFHELLSPPGEYSYPADNRKLSDSESDSDFDSDDCNSCFSSGIIEESGEVYSQEWYNILDCLGINYSAIEVTGDDITGG